MIPSNAKKSNTITSQLKVALSGLTMIQQSLLEFYFETQEGSQQFTQVLGKDADVYITNFDEHGAIEAWENLYAHEKKPTLVLSDRHDAIDNYIYIPKPITPSSLTNAAISLANLIKKEPSNQSNNLSKETPDFLDFSVDPQEDNSTQAAPSIDNLEEDELSELFLPMEKESSTAKKEDFSELDILDNLDDLTLSTENKTKEKPPTSSKEGIKIENSDNISMPKIGSESPTIEHPKENLIADITIETPETSNKEENPAPTFQKSPEIDNIDESSTLLLDDILEASKETTSEVIPADDLQSLLDELIENKEKQKDEKAENNQNSDGQTVEAKRKTKEIKRWNILCGEYDDISYKISSYEETHFTLTDTIFPYIKDSISFSKRSNCWMKMSYKYLSIVIDPESKHIHSSISLEDKNYIYLCIKNIDEDQVEFEEIDEQGIALFKQNNSIKYFKYSFDAFLWTTSLIVSHGRLPDNVNPETKISITNWLNLKEVEKFPYIMQIAAIFNQHHASLDEVATWMNLPKRYVYAFYNGVAALDMIEKDPKKSNKKSLIAMGKEKKEESTIKKLLFTKIM